MRRILLLLLLLLAPATALAQTTLPVPPDADTDSATQIEQTSAVLRGDVDPNGSSTTYHFEYGTTTAYGTSTPETTAGEGTADVPVRVKIEGLRADTRYQFRLVATNVAGTDRGSNSSFRTDDPPPAPNASTGSARNVGTASARLTGTVTVRAGEPTVAWFEYGTTAALGSRTPEMDIGSAAGSVPVTADIAGLRPDTRHRFRLIARSAQGVDRGSERSFTTVKSTTAAIALSVPRSVRYRAALTVSGRLTGNSAAAVAVALETSTWPFGSGFRQVGNAQLTGRDGSFRFTVLTLLASTRVRVMTQVAPVVTSNVRLVGSAVAIGLGTTRVGRRGVRFAGTVRPAVDATASLQRRTLFGRFVTIRRARARPVDGRRSVYSITVGRRSGTYRIRVVPHDGGAHVTGTSTTRRIG